MSKNTHHKVIERTTAVSAVAFVITSIAAAVFDLCFVIMQRCNCPRFKKCKMQQ